MTYESLSKTYGAFQLPKAGVAVEGRALKDNKAGLIVTRAEVDVSCGFEAAEAVYRIEGCTDTKTGEYKTRDLKPYIMLGAFVIIQMGYDTVQKEVFRGFIAKAEFLNEDNKACVEVTAMDLKGIMMANVYAKQLKAKCYSDAVREILDKPVYQNLKSQGIITRLNIKPTPDKTKGKSGGQSDAMEMVSESDYEFIVKAAKKYYFEFFTMNGVVHFRKAREDDSILLTFAPGDGMTGYRIGYDIRGIVNQMEVRSMEDGKGELISVKKKLNKKLSMGSYAKSLIAQTEKVYIDSTVRSKEQASDRLEAVMDQMSRRYGTLECECVGIPELVPGHYIQISGLGEPADNKFYLERVRHVIHQEEGYRCILSGSTDGLYAG